MNLAALIFDFDGVILDSVEIKTEAMRRLFEAEAPQHLAKILALHRRLGGVSRYEKFELIYSEILHRPLSSNLSAELGQRFEDFIADGVTSCGEIPGARTVLERYCGRTPLFVVSGTPQDELRRVAQSRGLDRYFVELHGSPPGKPEILTDLLGRYRFEATGCVFVGDAISDFDAACSCGVPFLGVVAPGLENPFADDVCVLPDLTEFEGGLQQLGIKHNTASTGAIVRAEGCT